MSTFLMSKKTLTSLKTTELVTWAVYQLGGDQRHIDTEDVAVQVFQFTPKRFGWRKYPEQINLELVRVYLSDAKKAEHGELLSGSGKTGWRLTRKGLEWIGSARKRLDAFQKDERVDRPSRAGSVDSNRRDREHKRILSLPAWTRWAQGERSVLLGEAREVFRLDSYATRSVRESKLTRLKAMFADDDEMSHFLAHLSAELDKEERETDGQD
jgi:hypothetical protein